MDKIKNIIGAVFWFLFITWASCKLYFIVIKPPEIDRSIGGALLGLLIAIIKIILALILFIPALIYGYVHMIFFSTDPKTDSISMLYIIVPCFIIWFVLKNIQNNVESNKINRFESKIQNGKDYKNHKDYYYKNNSDNEINKLKDIPITYSTSSNINTDDDSDDNTSSTDNNISEEEASSVNSSYDEDDNDSGHQVPGLRLLPTDCPDCDCPGYGKCSDCHGSGYETNVFDALAESLSGQSQKCKTCGSTGKCQTCNGRGYFNT